jgi:hypothetical protein
VWDPCVYLDTPRRRGLCGAEAGQDKLCAAGDTLRGCRLWTTQHVGKTAPWVFRQASPVYLQQKQSPARQESAQQRPAWGSTAESREENLPGPSPILLQASLTLGRGPALGLDIRHQGSIDHLLSSARLMDSVLHPVLTACVPEGLPHSSVWSY